MDSPSEAITEDNNNSSSISVLSKSNSSLSTTESGNSRKMFDDFMDRKIIKGKKRFSRFRKHCIRAVIDGIDEQFRMKCQRNEGSITEPEKMSNIITVEGDCLAIGVTSAFLEQKSTTSRSVIHFWNNLKNYLRDHNDGYIKL
uniref:Uncharacterized protein n=1 Tax=Syphacia muris TaxID=451379 RepID=A0A0N5B055_9BILA